MSLILIFCQSGFIEKKTNNLPSEKNSQKKDSIFDPSFMDTSYNPADDFYLYSNNNWLKNNPVPDQYNRYSSFEKLQEHNLTQLHEILEESMKHSEGSTHVHRLVGKFYSTGMDSLKIESDSNSFILNYFRKIDSLKNANDLIAQIAELHKIGINALFVTYGGQDIKNSDQVITQLGQTVLSLPNRDYYTSEDVHSTEIRKLYLKYIKEMWILTNGKNSNSDNVVSIIFSLEKKLAISSLTMLEQRNPDKIYNKTNLNGLHTNYPNFKWDIYFSKIELSTQDINIRQTDYFQSVNLMLNDIPVNDWKIYLKWLIINESAEYISTDFVQKKFNFYNTVISGNAQMPERRKRVLNTANSLLGEAIGQIYSEKYFSPDAKKKIMMMVMNIKKAMMEHISHVSWMSGETKKRAFEKLEAMNLKIGYPDTWKDYSGLVLSNESYLSNIFQIKNFNFRNELKRINKPMDRNRWSIAPQTINAFYSNSLNEIIFPAGILQPPFFDINADDALNYGAIGVVIGHEMTHGFDDLGKNFDKSGNLTNWWIDADNENFSNRTNLLVNYFDKYTLCDSLHINGNLTLGENLADLGGISVALTALEKTLSTNGFNTKINGYTPYQRFFLSYAQFWKLNIRKQELIRRINEDVHATSEARVNGIVYHIPEFYKAFNIQSGKRYIQPEKRIKIW